MSSFLSWVAGVSTPNNSGRSMDLFLTQLESMPQLMDKRQSAIDLLDAVKAAPDSVPSSVIPRILGVIASGIDDEDILQSCLDILCFLTELKQVQNNEAMLIENVSTLLCENSYVEILLSLFDSREVWIKIEAIQILKNCINVNQSIVEKSILGCPMGLQKLMDVLRDKREEVRNEMLILLRSLTRRNEEICKYIAFQDGFDILISILKSEEGIVARDCLHIIYNMIANSVLTLKLFSQRSMLLEIISILSISGTMSPPVPSSRLISPSTVPDEEDASQVVYEPMGDRLIDLVRYGDLELVQNVEIQCYQLTVSILELVMEDEIYSSDKEKMSIAQPIIEANRAILHSNPDYVFNILYFTFYQLRQNRADDAEESEEEQRRHNVDDLTDLSSRCEVLLSQCFRVATNFHLLQELLQIDILDVNGCHDLISFLLDGFLNTNVEAVTAAGLYKSPSVYVRLFMMLFNGDPELRMYLISPESGCGEVLKEAFIQSLCAMINGDLEVKSRFMLTTSVYRHCCEANGDGFLRLFVTDEQMKSLTHEKEVMTETSADMPPSEQETSGVESTPNQNVADASQTVQNPTETDAASIINSPKSNHSSGTLLVVVLLRMLLEPMDLSLQTHLASLLLTCLQHVNSVDPLFTNLPVIMDLFTHLKEDEKSGLFLDKHFSVQLLPYLRLFTCLSLLQKNSKYVREYIDVLRQEIGLDTVCNLGLRFFYLSKVRQLGSTSKESSFDSMEMDSTFVTLVSSVFTRFHDTLFSYYIELPIDYEGDPQMVINSYKELIRIQDQDSHTMKLVGGKEEGIELAEQYEVKAAELETAAHRIQDLEQEVYDWKNRFSVKEKALREKEEAYEQLEYCSANAKAKMEEEMKAVEDQMKKLEEEKESMRVSLEDHKNEHAAEVETMMISLTKKEEQVRTLDETIAHLESTIQELQGELQMKQRLHKEELEELEEELGKCRLELGSSQNALQQSEKRVSVLQQDYRIVEEELEEAKHELAQRASNQRSSSEMASLRAELERVRVNRDDLQIMVNELQEEKKMMEELVRSSMTPTSAPISPQDEMHLVNQPEEQQYEEQQQVEEQLEQQNEEQSLMEQQLEQTMEQQSVEQPVEQPVGQPLTQQIPAQVPISAEDFFTQPAPAKSKSD